MKHYVFASKMTRKGFLNTRLVIVGAQQATWLALKLRSMGFYTYVETA